MNFSRNIATALLLTAATALFSSVSFAGTIHDKDEIQALRDAAQALEEYRPDLSDKLNAYSDDESIEAVEYKDMSDPADIEAERAREGSGISLMREAAKALKDSRPDLALALIAYADKEDKGTR